MTKALILALVGGIIIGIGASSPLAPLARTLICVVGGVVCAYAGMKTR